jgi:hypothetical protein
LDCGGACPACPELSEGNPPKDDAAILISAGFAPRAGERPGAIFCFCVFVSRSVFCSTVGCSRGKSVSCPVCEKRKPGRFCPAKGEKICAVCCGSGREVTIDCPSDCAHLVAAHRYEDQRQRSIPADTPFLEVRLPSDTIHAHQQLMAALAFTIAKFCASQPSAADSDVLVALQALAETYKTLGSGIYYEKPPVQPLQRDLYNALTAFLAESKQQHAERANSPAIKDSDVLVLLIFLYRMGLLRTNGRSRARRYIEFLRGQFPGAQELKREESRIIVP